MADPRTRADELASDLELVGIVAVADNGVIGRDGEMPWHLPADLRHFKETTMDHPVIVGRVTYEGILETLGKPLPGRTMVVLTSRDLETPSSVVLARDAAEAIREAERAARERHDTDRVFVAGGGTVYEAFAPAIDRWIVTEVNREPSGDTHLPEATLRGFEAESRDERDGFAFVEYVRREPENGDEAGG